MAQGARHLKGRAPAGAVQQRRQLRGHGPMGHHSANPAVGFSRLRERAFSKGALQPAPSSSGASSAARGLVGDAGAKPDPAAAPPPAGRDDAAAAWHSAAAFAAPRAVSIATSASNLAALHIALVVRLQHLNKGISRAPGLQTATLQTALQGTDGRDGSQARAQQKQLPQRPRENPKP